MVGQWLHVSDFHFRSGDSYDSDVVTRAVIRSVEGWATGHVGCPTSDASEFVDEPVDPA
jgi:hypothetical protein